MELVDRFEDLRSSRANWDDHWQEIADFVLPRKNDINTRRTPGEKRNVHLLDNTAVQSNELLAGALHGLLTNPHSQFFQLSTGSVGLDQEDEVRTWLQDATRRIHIVLNNTNFQTEMHETYLDLGAFGTIALLMEEDEDVHIRFSAKNIGRFYIDENNLGKIDEVYRQFRWNARNIVKEFGEENVGPNVLRSWKAGTNDKFRVVHGVYPMSKKELRGSFKFWSQYTVVEDQMDVRMSNFREFPYAVPRWSKVAGEKYGRSPGMTALPEIKTLNMMDETVLIGAQKAVDPPLQLPDDGFIMPIRTTPGGLNYFRAGSGDRIEPVFNNAQIDFGFQAMAERRERIRKAFFVDQLKLVDSPAMTATEVLQRTEDQMRLLGPMMGRLENELLRPIVTRVIDIMFTKDLFAPVPEILDGAELDIRYSSLIAKAQRISEAQNILRAMEASAPFIEIDPASTDLINSDNAVKMIHNVFGSPQEIIRTKKDVEARRQARAEAQQAQIEAQKAEQDARNLQAQGSGVNQLAQAGS